MTSKDGKKTLAAFFSQEKASKWLILILLLGIGIIFLSELLPDRAKEEEPEQGEESLASTEKYVEDLEAKLEEMISRITGGEACVTLTAESGYKTILAQEDKESQQESDGRSSQSRENSYIVVKNADGSQSTVQVLQEEPQIRGVVVLCKNGDDAQVQQQIISAVTTVLHISSARVCVLNSN